MGRLEAIENGTRDESLWGPNHPRSDELKGKGRVTGSRLKPDLVWLRQDAGDKWRKLVVDMNVTHQKT